MFEKRSEKDVKRKAAVGEMGSRHRHCIALLPVSEMENMAFKLERSLCAEQLDRVML